jgi:uncharacterized protein YutE (UPF0331/DUF86 family)
LVDRDVFDRRLGRLEELLRHLRVLAAIERDVFLADVGLRAQAERWVHLAVECCLDLTHHLISSRGWRTPSTYRESFEVLAAEGTIDPDLARRMTGWAGLRNILVHLYLDVDHARLYEILSTDLPELERFARCLQAALDNGSE